MILNKILHVHFPILSAAVSSRNRHCRVLSRVCIYMMWACVCEMDCVSPATGCENFNSSKEVSLHWGPTEQTTMCFTSSRGPPNSKFRAMMTHMYLHTHIFHMLAYIQVHTCVCVFLFECVLASFLCFVCSSSLSLSMHLICVLLLSCGQNSFCKA